MAEMFRISDAPDLKGTTCTALSKPIKTGPIIVPPPSSANSLEAIWAEFKFGIIKILAGFESLQNG